MAEQHRATSQQWALIERMRHCIEFSCLIELRDRIEALEAAQPAKSNYPAKPDGSLVERVEDAISRSGNEPGFRAEARAAILEVAKWLSQESLGHLGSGTHWAQRLEREAER